jgi:hypothetical protein
MLDRYQHFTVVPLCNSLQWLVKETPINSRDSWYHTALRSESAKCIIESVRKSAEINPR